MNELNELGALFEKAERLRQEGSLEAAIEVYLTVAKMQPDSPEVWLSLAEIAHMQNDAGKIQEYENKARAIYEGLGLQAKDVYPELYAASSDNATSKRYKAVLKALACKAESANEYYQLATLMREMAFYKAAIIMYCKALLCNPNLREAHHALAGVLHKEGMNKQAIREYEEAYRQDPSDITALWGERLFLPTVYESEESMKQYRERWRRNLKEMMEKLMLTTPQEVNRAYDAALFHPNFLLAFQGDDILSDQLLYGRLISRIAEAKFPQYQSLPPKRKKNKIRVGFVSTFFRMHSIFKTHGAWITKLDRSRFEIFTFYLGSFYDAATKEIESHSDLFIKDVRDLDQLIQKIAQSDLDVLIYPDIGMASNVQLLASLRLAPVQCTALGHPVTSGLRSIDYMLSSDLMEVDDAQKQYSEKLVLLPNLSSCYPFPQVHTAVRPKELQIKDPNKVIFLNVHNLQTLLAPHDDLFPQLALKVPNAEFHFIGNQYNGTGKIFFERLQKVFQPRGLDAAKYCKFHPSMPQESFFGLLEYGDVVLDSLDWSGFNTTMEAIGFDKPVVTLPGVTCRSRHSYAILTMLGCPEFIAKTKEEYLQIAAHLSDPAARAQAAQKIRKNKMRIFEDQAPIKALEEFLTKVAGT